jgi:tetratricopeptide (TPR) repeat protein
MKFWKMAGLAAAAAIPLLAAEKAEKKAQEPFYRRFLVPGNPLDDRILEQEKRIADHPDSADLHNDMGNLLAQRRFPKEARQEYETALKLDKHHFLAAYNLGMVWETVGEYSHAIAAYEKSVNLNRGFPPARFRLGHLYERRGSNSQAIEQYARAIEIDPEMREPRYNPLVVDSALMGQVSLVIYQRDRARAELADEGRFADPGRFRRLPVMRPLASDEVTDSSAPEPISASRPPGGSATPAPLPARARETRPQAVGATEPAPVWNPTPPVPAPTRGAEAPPPGVPVFPTPLPQISPGPF